MDSAREAYQSRSVTLVPLHLVLFPYSLSDTRLSFGTRIAAFLRLACAECLDRPKRLFVCLLVFILNKEKED
jgi:hypothetical protein